MSPANIENLSTGTPKQVSNKKIKYIFGDQINKMRKFCIIILTILELPFMLISWLDYNWNLLFKNLSGISLYSLFRQLLLCQLLGLIL